MFVLFNRRLKNVLQGLEDEVGTSGGEKVVGKGGKRVNMV
jgi:hypothetical protein